jgi:hypothetical protein
MPSKVVDIRTSSPGMPGPGSQGGVVSDDVWVVSEVCVVEVVGVVSGGVFTRASGSVACPQAKRAHVSAIIVVMREE